MTNLDDIKRFNKNIALLRRKIKAIANDRAIPWAEKERLLQLLSEELSLMVRLMEWAVQ